MSLVGLKVATVCLILQLAQLGYVLINDFCLFAVTSALMSSNILKSSYASPMPYTASLSKYLIEMQPVKYHLVSSGSPLLFAYSTLLYSTELL